MAAKKKPAAAPAAAAGSKINRKRRNTLERKCLSKSFKRLFKGCTSTVFSLVLQAERDSRRKVHASAN